MMFLVSRGVTNARAVSPKIFLWDNPQNVHSTEVSRDFVPKRHFCGGVPDVTVAAACLLMLLSRLIISSARYFQSDNPVLYSQTTSRSCANTSKGTSSLMIGCQLGACDACRSRFPALFVENHMFWQKEQVLLAEFWKLSLLMGEIILIFSNSWSSSLLEFEVLHRRCHARCRHFVVSEGRVAPRKARFDTSWLVLSFGCVLQPDLLAGKVPLTISREHHAWAHTDAQSANQPCSQRGRRSLIFLSW